MRRLHVSIGFITVRTVLSDRLVPSVHPYVDMCAINRSDPGGIVLFLRTSSSQLAFASAIVVVIIGISPMLCCAASGRFPPLCLIG